MPSNLVHPVAVCIRRLRIAKGLSQEELAEKANLDRTYISGVERAVRNISLNSLSLIIDALDMTNAEFVNALAIELK